MSSIQFFEWTGNELILNVPEILLVKEFNNLYEYSRKDDSDRAFDYFRYIWLAYNPRSPYRDSYEEERISTALDDCGFSISDVECPVVEMAILKYRYITETATTKMLAAAKNAVDKIRIYFEKLDLEETDDKGRLKHNASSVIRQFKDLGLIHAGITDLERLVKSEQDLSKGIRGDNEVGFNN